MTNSLFETYKNTVITHVNHMFQTASDMQMETCMHTHHQNMHKHIGNMCCVVMRNVHGFIFKVQNNTNTIRILSPFFFNFYQHIARCTVHGRCPFNEKKQHHLCETSTDAIVTAKMYTRKYLS